MFSSSLKTRVIFLEESQTRYFGGSAMEDSCHSDSALVSGTSKTPRGAGTCPDRPRGETPAVLCGASGLPDLLSADSFLCCFTALCCPVSCLGPHRYSQDGGCPLHSNTHLHLAGCSLSWFWLHICGQENLRTPAWVGSIPSPPQ